MWVCGRYDLKLSEEEFWELTPAQYDILAKRHFKTLRTTNEQSDFRAAQICCILANINRDPKKKPTPYKVQDFMPKYKSVKKQTPEQQFELVKVLNAAFGGEVI